MIKPLVVGKINYPINLIQGPLAGISCAPFRRLTWRLSQPAYIYTEMISCKTILYQPARSFQRYIEKAEDEGPVCFQLAGTDPGELAEAVKRVTDFGADMIDLNCGCPVKKIRSKGAGSSLLTNPNKLYRLILTMKQNTHLPVSIKIRVESEDEKFNQEVANVINEAGADVLVVHGRHWTEHYETPCRYDEIAFFVQSVTIPVIGNGDIACVTSLEKMFATGCAGAMIGRFGVGQPWLIAELASTMQHKPYEKPALNDVGNLLIEHVIYLKNLLQSEKFALLQARKFAKYYARELKLRQAFCDAVNRCDNLDIFIMLCKQYFSEI